MNGFAVVLGIIVASVLGALVGEDARARGYKSWRLWAVFTFFIAILTIPIYVIKVFLVDKRPRIKPLVSGSVQEVHTNMNNPDAELTTVDMLCTDQKSTLLESKIEVVEHNSSLTK